MHLLLTSSKAEEQAEKMQVTLVLLLINVSFIGIRVESLLYLLLSRFSSQLFYL